MTALELVTALRERGWHCTDLVTIPDRRSHGEQFTVTVEDDTVLIQVKSRRVEMSPQRDWSSPTMAHHEKLADHISTWLDEVRGRRIEARAEQEAERLIASRRMRASAASAGDVVVITKPVGFGVMVQVPDEKLDAVIRAIRTALEAAS